MVGDLIKTNEHKENIICAQLLGISEHITSLCKQKVLFLIMNRI